MISDNKDHFIFESSGLKFNAHGGFIGITENSLRVSGGYDDELFVGVRGINCLTKDERRELADYMIDLWTKFKDK